MKRKGAHNETEITRRLVSTLALSTVFATLCTPAEGLAKLDVPYRPKSGRSTRFRDPDKVERLWDDEKVAGRSRRSEKPGSPGKRRSRPRTMPSSAPRRDDAWSSQTFVTISSRRICRIDSAGGSRSLRRNVRRNRRGRARPARCALRCRPRTGVHVVLDPGVFGHRHGRVRPADVSSLRCNQCEMTYAECLAQGNDWVFCKSRYLTCPREPTSSLSVSISVTSPASGRIKRHRECVFGSLSARRRRGPGGVSDYSFYGAEAMLRGLQRLDPSVRNRIPSRWRARRRPAFACTTAREPDGGRFSQLSRTPRCFA